MKAILRHTRISPKKANLVAGLVRGKTVKEALNILKFTPKKAAPLLAKTIKSAAANATNNFKQKKEDLYVNEIIVTKGVTMKRYVPVSRGRAHPILKMTSHITVKVGVETPERTEETKPEAKTTLKTKKNETTKKEEVKAEKAEEKAEEKLNQKTN